MKVTDFTRRRLAFNRFRRLMAAGGYSEVSEDGDPLWKFHRGGWMNKHITDVKIAPDGKTLFIKVV